MLKTMSSGVRRSDPQALAPFTGKKDFKKVFEKTIRLEVKLPQTTSESFPQYSYRDLVASASKKSDTGNGGDKDDSFDPLDPLGEDLDDKKLKELAEKFNNKYGPKKNEFGVLEDFIDKGMGYDETDPFIDNGEAYDELIPSTITTKHGGFYINIGHLEFKPIQGADEGGGGGGGSVDESAADDGDEAPEEGRDEIGGGSSSPDLIKQTHQQISIPQPQHHHHHHQQQQQQQQQHHQHQQLQPPHQTQSPQQPLPQQPPASKPAASHPLPDNLPEQIPRYLTTLRKLRSNQPGKQRFFDESVNALLLDIEKECDTLPKVTRQQVYQHLTTILPCTKDTILKRVKKLKKGVVGEKKIKSPVNPRIINTSKPVVSKYNNQLTVTSIPPSPIASSAPPGVSPTQVNSNTTTNQNPKPAHQHQRIITTSKSATSKHNQLSVTSVPSSLIAASVVQAVSLMQVPHSTSPNHNPKAAHQQHQRIISTSKSMSSKHNQLSVTSVPSSPSIPSIPSASQGVSLAQVTTNTTVNQNPKAAHQQHQSHQNNQWIPYKYSPSYTGVNRPTYLGVNGHQVCHNPLCTNPHCKPMSRYSS